MSKKETVEFKGTKFEVFYFSNPMFHEDWHKAEEMGLVYVDFLHNGPDYWDDEMVFCKKEHEKLAEEWAKTALYW